MFLKTRKIHIRFHFSARRARQFYRMRETTLCDICEGSDCSETCQIRASQQRSANGSDFESYFEGEERARVMETSHSITIYSSTLVLIASVLFVRLTI